MENYLANIKKQIDLTIEECLSDMRETDGFRERKQVRFFTGYANFTQEESNALIWDNSKNKEVKLWISDKSNKGTDANVNYVVYVKDLVKHLDEITEHLKEHKLTYLSGTCEYVEYKLENHFELEYYIKIPITRNPDYIKNEFEPEFNKVLQQCKLEEKKNIGINYSCDLLVNIWFADEDDAKLLRENGAKYIVEIKDATKEKMDMIGNYLYKNIGIWHGVGNLYKNSYLLPIQI